MTDLGALLPADNDVLAGFQSRFGALLTRRGRYEEAEPLIGESHRVLLGRLGPGDDDVRRARTRLDELYRATGRAGGPGSPTIDSNQAVQNR